MSPSMTPVVSGAGVARPWNIFLSSTIKDFKSYRELVAKDLQRYAGAACFPSEQWVNGFNDTVALCRTRVLQSDGFILLLGYWYGSVPETATHENTDGKSITHIEFDCALARWTDDERPMAVMVPSSPSPAHLYLTEQAELILAEQVAKGLDRNTHDQKRDQFHKAVVGSWRTVNAYETDQELAKQAISVVLRWQGQTPDAAASGMVPDLDTSEPDEIDRQTLGRLGRGKQLEQVSEILALLAVENDRPGVALVAHGTADSGPTEFLLALADAEDSLRRIRVRSLPVQQTSIAALTSWVAKSLGIRAGQTIATPEALADELFAALKREPLAFMLNRVGFVQGGVRAFAEQFWQPLYARLLSLAQGQPFQHQIVAVVTDWSGDTAAVEACTGPAVDGTLPDTSLPIALSPLGAITRAQVLTWLKEIAVPPDHRADLANAVLKDDHGNEDGTPSRVFVRLRAQDLDA